ELPAEKKPESEEPAAERKMATVLFSDMSGYTSLNERLDPEEVKEIMVRMFDCGCCVRAVHEQRGRLTIFIPWS
ncbi:MAG: hypothetical protein K9K64_11740, partial [Desulfohalobiaceae bacterium]|nr:hypothetical protein [Desulfohalobiaceae bacterium]